MWVFAVNPCTSNYKPQTLKSNPHTLHPGTLPNMVIMAPADEIEMMRMIKTSYEIEDKPSAVRSALHPSRFLSLPNCLCPTVSVQLSLSNCGSTKSRTRHLPCGLLFSRAPLQHSAVKLLVLGEGESEREGERARKRESEWLRE
jgi:hypothetical protein